MEPSDGTSAAAGCRTRTASVHRCLLRIADTARAQQHTTPPDLGRRGCTRGYGSAGLGLPAAHARPSLRRGWEARRSRSAPRPPGISHAARTLVEPVAETLRGRGSMYMGRVPNRVVGRLHGRGPRHDLGCPPGAGAGACHGIGHGIRTGMPAMAEDRRRGTCACAGDGRKTATVLLHVSPRWPIPGPRGATHEVAMAGVVRPGSYMYERPV